MAKEITFDQEKIDALLVEVTNELNDLVKSESLALAKAVKDVPAEESEGSSAPAAPMEASSPSPEASAPAPSPSPEASAPAPEATPAPAAEASAPAAPEGSAQPEAIEVAATPEQLQSEYAQLSDDELKNHYLACKATLYARMGGNPEPAAAPAPEASAPAPAPAAPPAMKSEPMEAEMDKKEDMYKEDMEKSATEILSLKKKLEDQNAALLELCEVVATPIRKSIKSISEMNFIGKTEAEAAKPAKVYSKEEAKLKLNEKIREGKLTKSEKELVMSFAVGNVGLDKVEHLLVDAK